MFTEIVTGYKNLHSLISHIVSSEDVTVTEAIAMAAIYESEVPLTIGTVANLTGIAKPNMTPNVDKLERKGYITRVRSGEDRRKICLGLTENGKAVVQRLEEKLNGTKRIDSIIKAVDTINKYTES